MLSQLRHLLNPKILPKVHDLNSLHPCCLIVFYLFPFLTFGDFDDHAVFVWDLWLDRAFSGIERRCVDDGSRVNHINILFTRCDVLAYQNVVVVVKTID